MWFEYFLIEEIQQSSSVNYSITVYLCKILEHVDGVFFYFYFFNLFIYFSTGV